MIKSLGFFFTFSCTITLFYSSCQISTHYESQKSFYFNIYFREFTAAINQPCSKAWLRMGESDIKNNSRAGIIITMCIEENCMKKKSKVLLLLFYCPSLNLPPPLRIKIYVASLTPLPESMNNSELVNGFGNSKPAQGLSPRRQGRRSRELGRTYCNSRRNKWFDWLKFIKKT